MGRDESGTLARLREHRKQRFEPTLARHGGRLVKLTGDGALVEFSSAVDALGAAIEFQQAMAEANQDQPEDTAIVPRAKPASVSWRATPMAIASIAPWL
jgi:adenylate cyclase